MTIRFACECGQQLSAREEYAGQRVRCSSCGEVQTVPRAQRKPAAATTTAAAPAGMIRFDCHCGQVCQARAEYAGRNTKCPRCKAVVTIPAAEEEEEARAPRQREAVQAQKPAGRVSARKQAAAEEEDQFSDFEEDRPRKRKKQAKNSKKWVWIGAAGVALLLVGGGVALWFFLGGSVSSDFDLVPRDAQGFVTIRVADLKKTPLGTKIMDKVGKQAAAPLREIESKAGLTVDDIERVTMVLLNAQQEEMWVIVKTAKDYDKDKVLQLSDKKAKEEKHSGKTYYQVGPDVAVHFHDSRMIVFAPLRGMKKCLEQPKKPKSGPLDDSLALASKSKYQIVGGMNPPKDILNQGRQQVGQMGPMGDQFKALLDLNGAYFTAAVKDDIDIDFGVTFPDKDKAKKASEAINSLVTTAKTLLPMARMGLPKQPGLNPDQAIAQAQKQLDQLKPKQDGKAVVLSWKLDGKELVTALDMIPQLPLGGGFGGPGGGGPGGAGVGGAANRARASNNLKQIALAFFNMNDATGRCQDAIYDQQGRPLLSWRVAILPYIEQQNLYRQFRLNEPWNSPNNRRLLIQMPRIYELPGHSAGPGKTFFQVFKGQNTPFATRQGARIPATFKDGTSNTFLVVEGSRAVNWTEPADIDMARTSPRTALGNHYGSGTLVSLWDGSVRTLPARIDDRTLRALISPSGNEVIPPW